MTENPLERRSDEFGLLQLAPGERLWKLYIFCPAAGRATRLEHRIYTKRKADGRLALVTFAVHTPGEGRTVRSAIARVPDLAVSDLDRIIAAIRHRVQAVECEELDLSNMTTLEEQLEQVGRWQIADGR
ncbi:MAG: hypothetical protein NT169_15270 [Chloroflexi bacterium]|nr:hypothetical protein [Chloroflexota bacterium]